MNLTKIGILGSGDVGKVLAAGYAKHGFPVMIGSRSPAKLQDFVAEQKLDHLSCGTFAETAAFGETLILASAGYAAMECLQACGESNLADKVVIDATNPLKKDGTFPPPGCVVEFFSPPGNNSLMEALQAEFPKVKFVKGFNSLGNSFMIDPDFGDVKPVMFICGNDAEAKAHVKELIEKVGHNVQDFGPAAVAGPMESLCQLWCARGFYTGQWNHAFALLQKE